MGSTGSLSGPLAGCYSPRHCYKAVYEVLTSWPCPDWPARHDTSLVACVVAACTKAYIHTQDHEHTQMDIGTPGLC